jgi:molecular chaperone GrpE
MNPAESQENPPGTPDAGAAPEVMPSLEQSLRQAELLAQEHHDAWLRARAEADNIRRRSEQEIAQARKFAVERMASDLLPVVDSLEASLAAANVTTETLRDGVELTLKQLRSVLEARAIVAIDPAGQKFDPHQHQAMSAIESDAEPNTVLQVFQKGYRLHERVIRPALVAVAKAKSAPEPAGDRPAA